MGYGLIDIGAQARQQALQGLQESARLDEQREGANKSLKSQQKAQAMSNIGTGVGMGALIGMGTSVGGPWGAAIGAGVGVLSSLF